MLGKLGRIDGDPVLRETRIWATWEYVSSVGGGQQGMVGLCALCGCGKLVVIRGMRATHITWWQE